jgi:hypothetical protein
MIPLVVIFPREGIIGHVLYPITYSRLCHIFHLTSTQKIDILLYRYVKSCEEECMFHRIAQSNRSKAVSLFPQCSIVGSHQCPEKVFTHCVRCTRAICLYHLEARIDQECLTDHPVCVVCLHPERFPRDPAVGRWRPYQPYRPQIQGFSYEHLMNKSR